MASYYTATDAQAYERLRRLLRRLLHWWNRSLRRRSKTIPEVPRCPSPTVLTDAEIKAVIPAMQAQVNDACDFFDHPYYDALKELKVAVVVDLKSIRPFTPATAPASEPRIRY
jgi:hypothetical protein